MTTKNFELFKVSKITKIRSNHLRSNILRSKILKKQKAKNIIALGIPKFIIKNFYFLFFMIYKNEWK